MGIEYERMTLLIASYFYHNALTTEDYTMNEKIKTAVNLLPVLLIPLINERKKIAEHPDVQKATSLTIDSSKKVADVSKTAAKNIQSAAVNTKNTTQKVYNTTHNTASNINQFVQNKKQKFDYNKEMKAYEKEQKNEQKELDKLKKQQEKEEERIAKSQKSLKNGHHIAGISEQDITSSEMPSLDMYEHPINSEELHYNPEQTERGPVDEIKTLKTPSKPINKDVDMSNVNRIEYADSYRDEDQQQSNKQGIFNYDETEYFYDTPEHADRYDSSQNDVEDKYNYAVLGHDEDETQQLNTNNHQNTNELNSNNEIIGNNEDTMYEMTHNLAYHEKQDYNALTDTASRHINAILSFYNNPTFKKKSNDKQNDPSLFDKHYDQILKHYRNK